MNRVKIILTIITTNYKSSIDDTFYYIFHYFEIFELRTIRDYFNKTNF